MGEYDEVLNPTALILPVVTGAETGNGEQASLFFNTDDSKLLFRTAASHEHVTSA